MLTLRAAAVLAACLSSGILAADARRTRAVAPADTITCDDRGCRGGAPAATPDRRARTAPPREARERRKPRRRQPGGRGAPVPGWPTGEERGLASFYTGKPSEGGMNTASGRRLDLGALTAAHKTLPMWTRVEVTNTANGRAVIVTITDRGPFIKGRVIDLTPAGARALGFAQAGVVPVSLRVVGRDRPGARPWIETPRWAVPVGGWASRPAADLSTAAIATAMKISARRWTPWWPFRTGLASPPGGD